ncbi:MAG: 30S ribosomal protein S1 [Nitrospira sp.]|nr:30S ribosomal protein S1 [Nitrospira sp.]
MTTNPDDYTKPQAEEMPAEASLGMAELWAEETSGFQEIHRGDIIEGVIAQLDRESILVDFGFKTEGVIPAHEMRSLTPAEWDEYHVGDKILAYVLQTETQDGQVILSLDRATGERGWRTLQQRLDAGEIFEAEVMGYNKGGLLVNVEGVRGFVPTSQVAGLRSEGDTEEGLSEERLAQWIGKSLRLKIIELNRRRNRFILSERAALQEWRALQKDRLLTELQEGSITKGIVTSIRPFGVFVDVGGADGLIHLSELAWGRNRDPEDVVNVGQEIDVYVLKVDQETKKIALSLRRAEPEAWDSVIDKYQISQLIRGTITKLTNFGAFASIEGPVEGLIHISELADRRISQPKEVVKEGDVLTLKIIRIERDRQRLGLSLRQALPEQEAQERVVVREQVEQIRQANDDDDSAPTLGNSMSASSLSALQQMRDKTADDENEAGDSK